MILGNAHFVVVYDLIIKMYSTELNWLVRKSKGISKPGICFASLDSISGCYHSPKRGEVMYGGRYYILDKGLLVIDEHQTDEDMLNTIVHEWRHHMQHMSGIDLGLIELGEDLSYEEGIIYFFNSIRTEMDALIYSNIHAPSDCTLEWAEWIIKRKENVKDKR
jgi:hypothetical protein